MSNFSTFKNFQPTVEPTGSISYSGPFFNRNGYIETGKSYLQSQYPSLFSLVGRLNAFNYTPRSTTSTTIFTAFWTGTNFIALGYNYQFKSSDGITWAYTSNINVPQISGGTFGNGFLYCSSPFVSGIVIARSSNEGTTWHPSLICGGVRNTIAFNSKYVLLIDDSGWSYTGYGGLYGNCDNATGFNGTDSGQGHGYYNGIVVG